MSTISYSIELHKLSCGYLPTEHRTAELQSSYRDLFDNAHCATISCLHQLHDWQVSGVDWFNSMWQHCAAGTYGTVTGLTVSTNCGRGYYSATVAATSSTPCIICTAGMYSLSGATACINCPAGMYGSATGLTVCTSCSGGYYSTTVAATSSTACITCTAGTFSLSGKTVLRLARPIILQI